VLRRQYCDSWIVNLRGIGQVMFQDNPLSGLLFFIAIGWGSWAGGVPEVAIGGLLAVLSATLMAQWLRVDQAGLNAGLYGFNGYLTGLALATFMAPTPQLWVYVVFGGAISVVVTLALVNVLKTWSVSALTAPFVLTSWLLLLGTNAFGGLEGGALPPVGVIVPIDPAAANPLQFGDFLAGLFASISQVFLKGHALAGTVAPGGLGRELDQRRRVCPGRRAGGFDYCAYARCRESADHCRSAGFQSGADSYRDWRCLLPSKPRVVVYACSPPSCR
jgi:urea transporter